MIDSTSYVNGLAHGVVIAGVVVLLGVFAAASLVMAVAQDQREADADPAPRWRVLRGGQR